MRRQDGWPALSIHGDKEQRERDWVLAQFKSSQSPIMVATDVAAEVGCAVRCRRAPAHEPSLKVADGL